ncbi:hypothetical protein RQP46_008260 [Phenoliferia psychrophenolica]
MSGSVHSTEKEPGPGHIESANKELGEEGTALGIITAHAGDEPVTDEEKKAVLRKIDWYLLPLMLLVFMIQTASSIFWWGYIVGVYPTTFIAMKFPAAKACACMM